MVGPRDVVVIESGVSFRHGEEIIAAVGRITRKPIRLAVITRPSQGVRVRRFGLSGAQDSRMDASQQCRPVLCGTQQAAADAPSQRASA